MRATSTVAQALASGYRRVLCCSEIEDARALRQELGDEAVVGGERNAVVIEGFEIDDAYCAGRIVELLDGERADAAVASAALARAYPTAWDGVNARTYGPPGLEDDLHWCTQENTLAVVPRFTRMVDGAAEITG